MVRFTVIPEVFYLCWVRRVLVLSYKATTPYQPYAPGPSTASCSPTLHPGNLSAYWTDPTNNTKRPEFTFRNTAVFMCTTISAGKEKKLKTWSGGAADASRFCRLQRVLGVSPGCTLCPTQITFDQQGELKTRHVLPSHSPGPASSAAVPTWSPQWSPTTEQTDRWTETDRMRDTSIHNKNIQQTTSVSA